jgi:4-amino-4-deoxy-L-arabinose transferase-like glycosyltransferase
MSLSPTARALALRHADLAAILLLALALRLALFNGPFGSDDTVYYQRALEISRGEWTDAGYNGALRYGFNLPAGLLMRVFGRGLFAANLWPLLCSLAEVATVWLVGSALGGRRVAAIAALLLAATPLHIAVASRIHADAVVSAALSGSFALLFFGLRRRSAALLFAAGLCLGAVYWAKEFAAVTYFAFLPLLACFSARGSDGWAGRRRGLAAALAGLALMFALHFGLMAAISGDPLHALRVVAGALQRNGLAVVENEDAAGYYLPYLFTDVRHVGLLGWLAALAGLGALLRRSSRDVSPVAGPRPVYLAWWLLGLLAVLSLFPVSLSPLRLAMKQSNYLSLFLAPLALAAAFGVQRLPRRIAGAALGLSVALGVALALLQQADYRAFTANGKALAALAAASAPGAIWVGSTNNDNLGTMLAHVEGRPSPWVSLRVADADPAGWRRRVESAAGGTQGATPADLSATVLHIALDPQTLAWVAGPHPVTAPRPCWQLQSEVQPAGLGLGNAFAGGLAQALAPLDAAPVHALAAHLERLAHPLPARVYSAEEVRCPGP